MTFQPTKCNITGPKACPSRRPDLAPILHVHDRDLFLPTTPQQPAYVSSTLVVIYLSIQSTSKYLTLPIYLVEHSIARRTNKPAIEKQECQVANFQKDTGTNCAGNFHPKVLNLRIFND
jgi:hypothetical protein